MILLDTTVLVYAAGRDHPLREPCRRLLEAHARRQIECATTVEVIQEFAHVYARSRPRSVAVSLAKQYVAAIDVLVTQPEDLVFGLRLYHSHARLRAFDAVLAAVALNQGVEALASADGAFEDVPELSWLNPAAATRPS